jgi:hypothetical protein
MTFSYETNSEIAFWSLILLFAHALLFFMWGLHGDEKHHEFYRRHGRDPRDNEVNNTAFLYFGLYIVASMILYVVCAFYFGAQNVEEDKRRAEVRYQEIYQQGMAAAEAGIPDTACPFRQSGGKYASNSPDERKWLEGWIAKTTEINKAKKVQQ